MATEEKIRLDGTVRARSAAETWRRIRGHLAIAEITRVADVTDLDYLGIPVAMAVRPLSESLAVSQGKGSTRTLAKISAAMESLETWHAENINLPRHRESHRRSDLGYDVRAGFDSHLRRPMLRDEVLEYCPARGLVSGHETAAPTGLVRVSFARCDHSMNPFGETSSGLASGNTATEAALHGIYEVFERDSTAGLEHSESRGIPVDLRSIEHPYCRGLIEKMLDAGWGVELDTVSSRFGVPTFVAALSSPDYPVKCAGAGTHGNWEIAAARALTEAIQTRLTGISGTRDDIPLVTVSPGADGGAVKVRGDAPAVHDAVAQLCFEPIDNQDLRADLAEAAARAMSVTGYEPIRVDLTHEALRDDISVVKVLVPGAVADYRGGVPGARDAQVKL